MTKGEETSERIIASAEKIFGKYGFQKATVAMIAKEAGCNVSMISYYFKSKEALFEKVNERQVSRMADRLGKMLDEQPTNFIDAITQFISVHYDLQESSKGVPKFFLEELVSGKSNRRLRFSKTLQELMSPFFARLHSLYGDAVSNGCINDVGFNDLMLSIISLNIAPFIIGPVAKESLQLSAADFRKIMERRKEENINLILNRLTLKQC